MYNHLKIRINVLCQQAIYINTGSRSSSTKLPMLFVQPALQENKQPYRSNEQSGYSDLYLRLFGFVMLVPSSSHNY